MSRIKILSEHLANQIAAGEVIERPASVVKELLENSIDAGARRVQLEIEGSGTKLIKIIDDGIGMDGDDALLCLERHATSKMGGTANDSSRLNAIQSLGFRGEAIPSIASVSRMTITSRTENDPLGTKIEVKYGKIAKIHEAGCNKGTVVEVRDLFGNLPARKKFLKSARTELFHIEEIIKNYSLAFSGIGITYKVNNSTVYDLPAETDTLEDRIKTFYSRNISAGLINIRETLTLPNFNDALIIDGFLLSPEQSFASSAKLRLFVNHRAVKDKMMAHAVSEGLSGYLMKGRSAAGALFVTLPYDAVDVNVHPTKQEIRFREPNIIHRRIVSAVRLAMGNFQKQSKQSIFGGDENWGSMESGQVQIQKEKQAGSVDSKSFWDSPGNRFDEDADAPSAAYIPAGRKKTLLSQIQHPESTATAEPTPSFRQAEPAGDPVPESLEPIGQIMDLYLLCEARRGDENFLVVIDQHAVHERILFENLKKQYESKQMVSQNLLFPKMLELPPEKAETLEKNMEQIRYLGLVVEEFGGDNYIIKAVPSVISHLDPEEILTGILAQFSGADYNSGEGRKRKDATRLDDILSTMACKAAIKAGQNLTHLEMKGLLKLMKESRAFTHCPHGRPVVRMFSATEIKKWFYRT
ncbi:MAG: DNA mismatch repair endonuclease MutL [Deltaproteobacteria bacterium]|nr:DNA mismatch repair endonuclease MutL [Deltaproteobacteria bacterium]